MDSKAVEAFRLLGIPRDSNHDAIAHAYRQLARSVHPDVSSDADAAERFASLAEAYRIAQAAPPAHVAPPSAAEPTGAPVPRRRVRAQAPQDPPIVAGPVRIVPPGRREERHG